MTEKEKLTKELTKIEEQLNKCRTSALEDGWQTSRHARKSRKWDFYAQRKMEIINRLDDIG